MSNPRNWHAVNAKFRKAGPHGGRRRPRLSEIDDVSERLSELVRLSEEYEEYRELYDYTARGMACWARLRVPCNEIAGTIDYCHEKYCDSNA